MTYTYALSEALIERFFSGVLPQAMEGCSEEIINNELYYIKSQTFNAKTNDELENYIKELSLFGEEGVFLFSEVQIEPYYIKLVNNTNIFSDVIIQKANDFGLDIYKLIYINLTVNMPSKVTEYSKGVLLSNGKTVSYTFEDLSIESSLEIKSKNTAVAFFITISCLLILTLIITVISLIRQYCTVRKDAEARRMPDIPIDNIGK